MSLKPIMTVVEAPDPKVMRAKCCDRQPGLLVSINGYWALLRDAPSSTGGLASRIIPKAGDGPGLRVCRGCFRLLDETTPTEPWVWGEDKQVDDHLRQYARELAGAMEASK